jgi:hypothetical protein
LNKNCYYATINFLNEIVFLLNKNCYYGTINFLNEIVFLLNKNSVEKTPYTSI